MRFHLRQALQWAIYGLATLIGIGAFLYPFFMPMSAVSGGMAHLADSPLLLTLLGLLSLAAFVLEMQGDATADAKRVALLGVLVGLNAAMGFLETAIPGPGGFSPVFFLIIVGGYVFGGKFGFLLGALTLLVSALVTGGVGPWLPYRMLVAGWVGLTTSGIRFIVRKLHAYDTVLEIGLLAVLGGIWGLTFGVLMDLWFWPFVSGPSELYWQSGIGLRESLRRYFIFYATTSLIWDLARSIGTIVMLVLFGRPTLRALRRFQRRFTFEVSRVPLQSHSPRKRTRSDGSCQEVTYLCTP